MKPDSEQPEDKQEKRDERGELASGWRPALSAPPAPPGPVNRLRAALGFRQVPPTLVYLRGPEEGTDPGDDMEAWQRAKPYTMATLLFAMGAFLLFWLYGAVARGPTMVDTRGLDEAVREVTVRLRSGDLVGAMAARDSVREQHRDDPAVDLLDGHIVAAQEETSPAVAVELLARASGPRPTPKDLVTLAGYREAIRDSEGALAALSEALELRPNNVRIRMLRGSMLLGSERWRDAIGEANKIEDLVGANATVFEIRGRAFLGLDEAALARREFWGGLMYEDDSVALRMGLADALIRLGDVEGAARELNAVMRYQPINPDVHVKVGELCERAGRPDDAETAYRRALEWDPEHVQSLNNLAYVLAAEMARPAEALEYAKRALELAPSAAPALDTLGWTYYLLGDYEEAVKLLLDASKGEPDHPEIRLHLACALVATGSESEGIRMLRALIDAEGDSKVGAKARTALESVVRPAEESPPDEDATAGEE